MAPLNDRNLTLFIQMGEPVAHVIDDEAENAEALGHTEFVAVGHFFTAVGLNSILAAFKHHAVVRLKHDELQLNVIRDVWPPLAIRFLLQIDIELNMVFNLIVLWVGTILD